MHKIHVDPAYRRLHTAEAMLAEFVKQEMDLRTKAPKTEQEITDLEISLAAVVFEVKQATETVARTSRILENRCRRDGCSGTRRKPRKSGSDRKRRRGNSPFCGPCSGVRGRISTRALRKLVSNVELNVTIAQ